MGTYNNLITELRARLGGRTDVEARLPVWLNDAYFELLLSPTIEIFELDTAVTVPTIAGLRIYSLVSLTNLWHILGMLDETNEREVRRWSWKAFDQIRRTTGQPTKYARFGTNFYLDPTPNGVYNLLLRYRQRPNELAEGGSTVTGREWDEPLLHLAAEKGYIGLERHEQAMKQRQLYEASMARRETVPELEDEDAEPTIGVYRGL